MVVRTPDFFNFLDLGPNLWYGSWTGPWDPLLKIFLTFFIITWKVGFRTILARGVERRQSPPTVHRDAPHHAIRNHTPVNHYIQNIVGVLLIIVLLTAIVLLVVGVIEVEWVVIIGTVLGLMIILILSRRSSLGIRICSCCTTRSAMLVCFKPNYY